MHTFSFFKHLSLHPSPTTTTFHPLSVSLGGGMWSAWIRGCWHASFSSSRPDRRRISHTVHLVRWSHAAPHCYIPYVWISRVSFSYSVWVSCSRRCEVADDREGLGLNVFKGCQQKTCLVCSKWVVALFCAVGDYCAVTESGCFTHEGAGRVGIGKAIMQKVKRRTILMTYFA